MCNQAEHDPRRAVVGVVGRASVVRVVVKLVVSVAQQAASSAPWMYGWLVAFPNLRLRTDPMLGRLLMLATRLHPRSAQDSGRVGPGCPLRTD
ncbi:MAG: hypothetical protein QOH20_1897 [Mycobacterium sp.]|jgi:hypothetical protein|nr:hypothetical protein [Mycobacterium sp.]